MGEQSNIEWTDATFNPWWGCSRVSPACAHCYADTLARRFEVKADGTRDRLWADRDRADHDFRFFGDKHWNEPLKWARTLPAKLGRRPRVFCASMADVFEDHPAVRQQRRRLFKLIAATPELDWLILTKRPDFAYEWLRDWFQHYWSEVDQGNHPEPLPWTTRGEKAHFGVHPNIWIGTSVENARFTWRADYLRLIPAPVRFISAEPLLGSLFPSGPYLGPTAEVKIDGVGFGQGIVKAKRPLDFDGIDWVIIGGESGPKARPFYLEHAREIVRRARGLRGMAVIDENGPFPDFHRRPAVFVKQLGAKPRFVEHMDRFDGGVDMPLVLADRKGGDIMEWPLDLRIREYPVPVRPPSATGRTPGELIAN